MSHSGDLLSPPLLPSSLSIKTVLMLHGNWTWVAEHSLLLGVQSYGGARVGASISFMLGGQVLSSRTGTTGDAVQ